MLNDKKILICVTGGIAVYKAVALVSKLSQAGANVKVIMTESAKEFVTPLTFQAMSRNDVYFDTFDEKDSRVIAHIDLADWADLVIVAPATANVLGKVANGIADNMVTTTLLATTAEIWFAPAMNVHMYENQAVKRNIATLASDGHRFIEPSEGFLACGYVGRGRLEEPERIVELVKAHFKPKNLPLTGKKVVVTAGPTRERIDPVRYISNFSSGKMGYSMAEAAASLGAETILISGPVSLDKPAGVKIVDVESAAEMFEAVRAEYHDATIVIKSAAVADYRPAEIHTQKIKKSDDDDSVIELARTTDILQTLGEWKEDQVLVGFAAETENVIENGKGKLQRKNLDYIIVNDVTDPGGGFGSDTNVVTLISKNGTYHPYSSMPKKELATVLLQEIVQEEGLDTNNDS
ncbi:bifunctional phosphopantothenoylcysteine decarboxylase/phosphopantothenate--cysteine ligase CoaBC [Sporosarcina pasteurii]|uniref:Coenzyme A biosynthesis bifunctional protein CoaBC n=1 Tax=Sporosarcina pasteurii TaxID=1474 RepID=A0A380BF94_SPOPA|nr:bifunctional phosphopantothenoylcysteine decarboxylase/phosphopantothenate--cysteine ligase CoaBC [Sporosarcina pasteurii]MDS9470530.1 bifunctional phosphopantothenoylcysteine decarboxylase/phosphopantothenate--cysteine ligase CoaBC [Sporosarcina pasteurii]QBQ05775.1 bifunctional phosphopantothenoylcysteine decarboxylase/phosphopantothenate--cysteine ligase CoaBC [Sporosarcina pasteurii]SUJ00602.1 DNA/pantothenate metabolism flavoprotein [Sporosarcina pasteurii]